MRYEIICIAINAESTKRKYFSPSFLDRIEGSFLENSKKILTFKIYKCTM